VGESGKAGALCFAIFTSLKRNYFFISLDGNSKDVTNQATIAQSIFLWLMGNNPSKCGLIQFGLLPQSSN
jgi:hypothetical protein